MSGFGVTPRIAITILAIGLVAGIGMVIIAEQRARLSPSIEIAGGGFVYNYRLGEFRYSLTVHLTRPRPIGTVLEAEFENPAGGDSILVSRQLQSRLDRYGLESPALSGVQQEVPYQAWIRLKDRESGQIMETLTMTFRTNLKPGSLGKGPLTIGPGYHPAPPVEQ